MIDSVRGRRAATFVLATSVALATFCGAQSAVAGSPRASSAASLDGVWRMDGYGTLEEFASGRDSALTEARKRLTGWKSSPSGGASRR